MQLLPRAVEPWLRDVLSASPVVVVEGARQVGKSTLVGMVGGGPATYATMDDDVTRAFAQDDPGGFLRSGGSGRLVVDEVQRCPELILPLKAEVDRDRRPGRFILTRSANLLRVPQPEDSLAGRAMTIRLHPFSQGELAEQPDDWVSAVLSGMTLRADAGDRGDVIARVTRGGYPSVQGMSERMAVAWLKDYSQRLVERDSANVGPANLPVLHRILSLLAAAPGCELVLERLGASLGIARGTVARYLDILESLFLIYRLPSWSRNLTSRQVQRPKCYLTDSGLAAVISGLSAGHLATPQGANHLGPLLENFVVCELLRQQGWSASPFSLSYFRDRNGSEVDLIIEVPQGVIGVEIKAATAARADDFKHLVELRARLGHEFLAGIVLTTETGQQAGDRLFALPVSSLWMG